jgi:hypothetical protein
MQLNPGSTLGPYRIVSSLLDVQDIEIMAPRGKVSDFVLSRGTCHIGHIAWAETSAVRVSSSAFFHDARAFALVGGRDGGPGLH